MPAAQEIRFLCNHTAYLKVHNACYSQWFQPVQLQNSTPQWTHNSPPWCHVPSHSVQRPVSQRFVGHQADEAKHWGQSRWRRCLSLARRCCWVPHCFLRHCSVSLLRLTAALRITFPFGFNQGLGPQFLRVDSPQSVFDLSSWSSWHPIAELAFAKNRTKTSTEQSVCDSIETLQCTSSSWAATLCITVQSGLPCKPRKVLTLEDKEMK